jgi:hypothetical protein
MQSLWLDPSNGCVKILGEIAKSNVSFSGSKLEQALTTGRHHVSRIPGAGAAGYSHVRKHKFKRGTEKDNSSRLALAGVGRKRKILE